MTYSLGFDALMTAHLAFGMLGDMDEKDVQTPHLLLEAILKNSDKMVIFCNKGSIAVPPTIRKVYSLLEKNIFEVFNPDNKTANFHPKMWLIREVNNDNNKDVLMKLIVSSRNMAYSDNIDCIACITGKVGNAQTKNEKHRVLRKFIEKVVTYSNITEEQASKVLALAKEVERVEKFDVDKPFDDYDFYPYLFQEDFELGKIEDYLCGTESIIVSPFIDKTLLGRINPNRKEHRALITRKEYVTTDIFNMFAHKGGVFIALDDLASRGMDLHAKMYLVWMGRERHYLYLGSANATNSAFERNGEFLLRLKFEYGNSKYYQFLKDFYEEGNKDSKFVRLNEPIEKATTVIRWDNAELAMKEMMCADDLKAKITKHRDNTFTIVVTSSLKKLGNPVFIAPLQKRDMQREWKGRAVFDEMSADELSEFYIVSSQCEDGKHHEAIIRIATEGMPNDRDTVIYKSIIKNKHDFVKFLELMLSDTPVQYISNEILQKEKGTGESEEGYEFAQIYEKMLRMSAVNPKQILQIGKMLDKLDSETVPEEFRKIYKQFSIAIK
jgi:HKD family nuclease